MTVRTLVKHTRLILSFDWSRSIFVLRRFAGKLLDPAEFTEALMLSDLKLSPEEVRGWVVGCVGGCVGGWVAFG